MIEQPAKLRVAHIITQLELGGAQRNTLYTLGHLNAAQYEPILICGPGGLLDEEATAGAWSIHYVRWLVRPVRPWKDALALVSLYQLLRAIKPHIVHTHSSKAGILGRMAAYLAGVPVIIHTFHGFGFTPGQNPFVRRFFIRLEKTCAWLSTHLVFVSEANRSEAAQFGIGTKIPCSLIRSGIQLESKPILGDQLNHRKKSRGVRHDNGIPADAWVVVSVGNFKPQKNPLDLLRVAAIVLRQKPEIHFLLVGDGELRSDAERLAAELGVIDRVHFLGWLKRRSDIWEVLEASNCFLLTSLWEGLPRALLEAGVEGKPAVAYAVDGVRDILLEGENGFPIPPRNIDLAAEKILWLVAHPREAKLMGQKARQRIGEEFNINLMVRQQENLYRELYQAVPLKSYYEPLWSKP